jgi:hypothetical protein
MQDGFPLERTLGYLCVQVSWQQNKQQCDKQSEPAARALRGGKQPYFGLSVHTLHSSNNVHSSA